MGDESRVLEEAKSEALAPFAATAAAIDLSGEQESAGQTFAFDPLRAAAVRHLSTALEIMRRANGGNP